MIPGTPGLNGDPGDVGPDGKSAYEIAVDQGFQGTDTEWIESLNGEDGEDGDSAYDIYAGTVTDPNDLLSEPEWIASLKGSKGDDGSDFDTDKYYTKSQVDQIIEVTTPPERSYIFDEMTEPFTLDTGDTVDFRDNNQQLEIYNPGLIQVKRGAIVDNVPLNPPFFLRNTVVSSLLSPRGVDHTVMQEIFSVEPNKTEMWFRIAQPGTNTFGDWDSGGGFDEQNYYTKSEVSMLVNGQVFYLEARDTDISLRDKIGADAGTIPLVGTNGIKITNDGSGTIKIDGTDLLNEDKLFLGILEAGEDPTTKFPDAKTGNFFVFAYEGDAPAEFDDGAGNVPTVKGGDLAYYDEGPPAVWNFVESSAGGLLDVNVPVDGLLEIDKTDPKKPVIELDPDKVVTPDELDPYATWAGMAELEAQRRIGQLKDVNIDFTPITFAGQTFNKVEYNIKLGDGERPVDDGMFAPNSVLNSIKVSEYDKNGNDSAQIIVNNLDITADPPQKVRVRTSAGANAGYDGIIGHVISRTFRGDHYELQFDTPAVPLACLYASDIIIDIVTEDTKNGQVLAYNENTDTWDPVDGGFVQKIGDEMSGKLDIKMNSLNDVGLKVLGGLRIKRENNINGKNALTVNHDNIVFEAKTTFKRPEGQSDVANFAIEGKRPGSSTITENLFTVYRAPGTEGDAINYYGRIQNPQNIINKGHLDETINFQQYPELT